MLCSDLEIVRSSVHLFCPEVDEFSLTDCTCEILLLARKHATARNHEEIAPEHLLLGMATHDKRRMARAVLERLGVELPRGATQIAALLLVAEMTESCESPSFSPQMVRLLREAKAESKELRHTWVGSEHLALGLLRCGPCAAGEYLKEKGVTAERFREETLKALGQR
jgi:ATP-dependent Clp protease ATP-binding subunit ClpC